MVTILPALRQVREDLVKILDRETVERLCDKLGYRWRSRQLDPWTTLHLFILQVLNNNTAMTHLPHLSGERFTASAYCQARQRLPLELLEKLVNQFGGQLDGSGETSALARAIACCWWTARASPCRTRPSFRPTSASRATRSPAADSRWLICWPSSMAKPGSCGM